MSQRASIFLIIALGTLLVVPGALGTAAGRAADNATLNVTFRADKTVSVVDGNGVTVGSPVGAPTVVGAGTYNVLISDPTFVSDIEWDLSGPGVKLVTSMSSGEEISESWVETFQPNSTYTYRDDNRPGTEWTFVTNASAATGGSGAQSPLTSTTPISTSQTGKAHSTDPIGSKTVTFRGTLLGSVSPTGKAVLDFKGKPVTSLRAGSYTFAITDSSSKAGFTVQENKKSAKTLTASTFKGKKTVKVTLAAGQWFFYPTFVAKKTYFIVVVG
ncbi:MAG TPA: hypothetical protein VGM80_00720 [Gaiellaceae bacterium]